MEIRVRCQKSPIISPDLGNGRVSLLFPRIVRGDADKTPRFAFPSKPDCALNQLSRPESLPDTESFPGGYCTAVLRRWSGSSGPREGNRLVLGVALPRMFGLQAIEVLIPVGDPPRNRKVPM